MDRQLQDQLDESAGKELVARIKDLNMKTPECSECFSEEGSYSCLRMAHKRNKLTLCPSCGGNVGGMWHYGSCVSGIAGSLEGYSVGGSVGSPNSLRGVTVTEPTARERYVERFKALQAEMLRITLAKNNDYGGHDDPFKNFREYGAHGILVRLSDKMARLKTAIVEKRKFEVTESVSDTCIDAANYCLLLLCVLEEGM